MTPCTVTEFTDSITALGFSNDERLFTFQLFAWSRLSNAIQTVAKQPDINMDNLLKYLEEWVQRSDLGENQRAFQISNPEQLNRISADHLQSLLSYLAKHQLNQSLNAKALVSALLTTTRHTQSTLPSSVNQLMVSLTNMQPNDTVYLPLDSALQLTVRALDFSKHIYVEQTAPNPLPALVNLLCNQNIQVHVGDCIDQPGFLENDKLARFDHTVAMPGFGKRYDSLNPSMDPHRRFVETTASIAILTIRHIMATTKKRAVVAVPNGLLCAVESQRLREDLLQQGRIETVIAMPAGLLSWSGVAFSIWILRFNKPCEDVLFIDATDDQFWTLGDDKRRKFNDHDHLISIVAARTDADYAILVPIRQILSNQARLNVPLYCKNQEQKRMEAFWAQFESTCRLSDIATLQKVTRVPYGSVAQTVLQLNPADFQRYGYSWSSHKLNQNQLASARPLRRIQLQPHDLVIVTRGDVGKVALIPPDLPNTDEAIWVVAETCSVIRLKQPSRLDARVLYSFLRSEIGWDLLSHTIIGAQNRIELSALMASEIPVLTEQQQHQVLHQFELVIDMENQIQQLQRNKRIASEAVWQAFTP